jgi:hypothetical protein|tara:strand:- start:1700 stop:2107 length:408 start_codon:yes stop_codon:yes gene_type:complete
MFTKKGVKELAKIAYSEFSEKHKVSCKISMVNLDEFWKLAKKSKLIQDDIKKRIPLKVGALVVHGEKDNICLNEDILNNLTSDSNYVKAVVIHELYHVYLKKEILENNLVEEIKSENRVDNYIKKEFPKYSKYFI